MSCLCHVSYLIIAVVTCMNSSWTMCSKTSVRISSSCLEQCNALATFVSPSSSFVCPVISFGFAFDEHWWTLMNTVRLWVPEIDRWKWRERSWVGIYYQRCEMCEQKDAEKLHNRYFVEAVILPGGLFEIAWGQSDRQRPTDQWERFTISLQYLFLFLD